MDGDVYQPESYLTLELLARVVEGYQWPAPYTLEDEMPDGIAMCFPLCTLFFVEGFEGNMVLTFVPEETGTTRQLNLTHALMALVPESERGVGPLTPGLIHDASPAASRAKVENGIRDLCVIIRTHLQGVVLGDFGWVEDYLALSATE